MIGKVKRGVVLTCRVSEDTHEKVKERAEQEKRTLSNMISVWVEMMANGAELTEPKPKRRKSNG